jgi:hypothetical protein
MSRTNINLWVTTFAFSNLDIVILEGYCTPTPKNRPKSPPQEKIWRTWVNRLADNLEWFNKKSSG